MANFHSDEWIAVCRLNDSIKNIEVLCDFGLDKYPEGYRPDVEKLFKEVQYDIMKFAVAYELMEEEYYD